MMNVPNLLTISRIALTVVFLYLLFLPGALTKEAALMIFLLASFTDYWDGHFARKYNQVTPFGRLMDPIADKLLTLSAFMGFVQMRILPAWMIVIIITRDLLITGFRLTLPNLPLQAPGQSGKHKTALQFIAIIGILSYLIAREQAFWDVRWDSAAAAIIFWGMLFVVVVTLFSGIRYVWKNQKYFNYTFTRGLPRQ